MIRSMTGYGDAQHCEGDVSYALEMRSLNNRYFKPTLKLPEFCQFLEPDVDKLLRRYLTRGSVSYSLRVRNTGAEAAHEINREALQSYLRQMAGVGEGPVPIAVDLASVLALPGVCQPPEMGESEREQQWEIIRGLTTTAVEKLVAMRTEEGKALCEDLRTQCDAIRQRLEHVRTLAPEVVTEYHKRLRTRVNALLSQAELQLAETDLAKEVAVFADRCDISEELARLTSHLDQFLGLCNQDSQAGRRLEFLAQEMLREANTIASKSNNSEITRDIVEVKSLIDRLKEQVQNVE